MSQPEIAPVIVVLGDEELLVERAVADLVAAARAVDSDAEVHDMVASQLAPGQLAELTSPSLFGGRRVVLLRSDADLGKDVAAELVEYVGAPADDVTVVVTHAAAAKGKGQRAALGKAGAKVIEVPKITKPSERIEFIRAELRRAGCGITEDAARALLDAVGTDLRELAAACSQLAIDTTGSIDTGSVARYYRGRAEATGFIVADRAIEGRLGDALEQTRWALAVGVSPVLVISALAQGLRSLAKVGSAARTFPGPRLAKELGVPSWKIDRIRQQLLGWTPDGVARAMRAVAEADALVKGGGADPGYALERAVRNVVAARTRR